jgi:hypothetical protein
LGFLHLEFNKGQILSDIVFPFFEVSSWFGSSLVVKLTSNLFTDSPVVYT